MPDPYPPGSHVFVDESKARGYYVAASVVAAAEVNTVRRAVAELRRPGQRRVHFKSESDSTRKAFISSVARMEISAVVYMAQGPDRLARPQCLRALVADAGFSGAGRLVLERDESVEAADRRVIAEELRRIGAQVDYRHCQAYEEPMLWVSDAVAWCFQKGGAWRAAISPIVADVRHLPV